MDKPKVHGKTGVVAKTKDPVLASAWQAPGSSRKNRGWYNFRNHRRRDVVLDPCVSPECRAPSTPVGMNTKSARIRRTNFGSRILLTYDQTLVCVGRAQEPSPLGALASGGSRVFVRRPRAFKLQMFLPSRFRAFRRRLSPCDRRLPGAMYRRYAGGVGLGALPGRSRLEA